MCLPKTTPTVSEMRGLATALVLSVLFWIAIGYFFVGRENRTKAVAYDNHREEMIDFAINSTKFFGDDFNVGLCAPLPKGWGAP